MYSLGWSDCEFTGVEWLSVHWNGVVVESLEWSGCVFTGVE